MKRNYFGDVKFDEAYFTGKHPAGYKGGYNKKSLTKDFDCYTHFKEDAKFIKDLGIESYLEIGCACGFLMEELLKLGVKARGWDISKFIVEKASPEVRPFIEIKSIDKISSLPDKAFDLVHVSGVLGYVSEDKLDYYLSELKRIARKYVIVYVGTPAEDDMPEENSIRLVNRSDGWWNKKFAEYFKEKDLENCVWKVK
ncbi:MAG: class I SAM-dependent methyltransferase [Patescibacteria group bacterium]|nr:class I SAM-dependent methyltransferase [Patescibacteria group bacterium]